MMLTEIFEKRGYTVTKETSVQLTAYDEYKRFVVNKHTDGSLRVSHKTTRLWSDPLTLRNSKELAYYLDIQDDTMYDMNGLLVNEGDKVIVVNRIHDELNHGIVLSATDKVAHVRYQPSLGPERKHHFDSKQILKWH